jgi:hypothetical protein
VNILSRESRKADKGWYSRLGAGRGANNFLPLKKKTCYEMLHRASELEGPYEHGSESLGSIKGGEFD